MFIIVEFEIQRIIMHLLIILLLGTSLSLFASASCQSAFPNVLSSETSITFHTTATLENSGSDLSTPQLFTEKVKPRCDGDPCTATEIRPTALRPFTFQATNSDDTVEISSDMTLDDSDIGDIVIMADDVTITFDAPSSTKGFNRVQKIGSITDNAKNTTYIFKAGDYHIRSWMIDNNPGNQKNPVIKDHLNIQPEGIIRLFINEGLTIDKFTPPDPNEPVIAINNDMQTKQRKLLGVIPAGTKTVKASPSQLLIYSLGDISIHTFGNYDINAIIYGFREVALSGDPLSRFIGAIHSKGNLNIGRENKPTTPTGTFVYDSYAVESLYRDFSICSTIPEEPGSLNNETVLGIDVNRNLVRDDVEIWILENYEKQIQQKALMQYAINYQKFWGKEPTQEIAFEAQKSTSKAVQCVLHFGFRNMGQFDGYDDSDQVDNLMLNTPDRLRAEGKIMDLLAGHVFKRDRYGKDACNFDVDALEE